MLCQQRNPCSSLQDTAEWFHIHHREACPGCPESVPSVPSGVQSDRFWTAAVDSGEPVHSCRIHQNHRLSWTEAAGFCH